MSENQDLYSVSPSLRRNFLQAQADILDLIIAEFQAVFSSATRKPFARFCWLSAVVPLMMLWQWGTWFFFFLDEVLFPAGCRQEIVRPLFVVGPPRSGTTHLHRILAESSSEFSTASAWELFLAPSICQKTILKALRRLDRKVGSPLMKSLLWVESRITKSFADTHPGSLRDPEEDYFYLAPLMACTGWMIPFPTWRGFRKLLPGCPEMSGKKRRDALHFYRRCLQKQLYVSGEGKTLLSKNASFSSWMDLLPEFFPDARWVVCMRSSLETVPSMLSTAEQAMDGFFARQESPEFKTQLVASMEAHYQVLDRYIPGLSSAVVIEHSELKDQLPQLLEHLETTFDLCFHPDFKAGVEKRGQASRNYRSPHRYSLEDYNLSSERLLSRCPLLASSWRRQPCA